MTSDRIREQYLSFFEARAHRRLPSASLVPAQFDPSVLLTTAGMHPLKPYFQGVEAPPAPRLTSCQKCFRTTDIENVGNTARHITFFEMLGNFSIGDYFKEGAVEFALELSGAGFGFALDEIWVTVFAGDDELGVGPDEEAIRIWEAAGIPRSRIVPLPRSENWWQSGPTGPCGPCSELYLDRGVEFGEEDDLPGGENERFLEYWNLVFMQFDQDPIGTLTPLPAKSIDTGLGLNRLAVIQQGVPTIFETDQFLPLMALGRELATRDADERALRVLADHTRAMTFLIGDGVVPSNEDRGYILRRVMRRAMQQGHRIGIEQGFLPLYVERVVETMGAAYPEVVERRATILKWVRAEEESFGRTLEQGTRLLEDLLSAGEVSGADAFRLHDTYGFPIELTRELADERGVPFAGETEFSRLMDEQRARSKAQSARTLSSVYHVSGPPTRFTGYETLAQRTTVSTVDEADGRLFVKLAESPFYAEGGGQVSDSGVLECEDGECLARVVGAVRAGDDQALIVEAKRGTLKPGERVLAEVDRAARHATMCNHTATHLLHAALREELGEHVHQAGSYVGPDKLRFDFSHTQRLAPEERRRIEDRVNEWVLRNDPVRPITTTLDEARSLGAMALFGEKYGDVVRMVQIGDGSYSRELCGGTHVRSTAEIGVFKILSEGSSASNVRRVEAVTGPEAVALLRREDELLREAADALRTQPERVPDAIVGLQERAKQAARAGAGAATDPG
ncbi:MAG TPA: alanine--tRNA ligase, partial [Solirubrobacteraceae bacterium]|nr:alanine--tRNA ligase [Solirubrobacteraceae bacterium]